MNTTEVRPREFYTRYYVGSDGSRMPLCTYHVRTRTTFGDVTFEPETPGFKRDACAEPCADCVERAKTQRDGYATPLVEHHESLAINSDVICYALEDMISTLEICADLFKEQPHVEAILREQKRLREIVDLFDTSLNERYAVASRFSEMLDDDGNEATEADDEEF